PTTYSLSSFLSFFLLTPPPLSSTLFPYTTLFRSLLRQAAESRELLGRHLGLYQIHSATRESGVLDNQEVLRELARLRESGHATLDRKSTRLNSSHLVISYAVFCLKKKKKIMKNSK